jgi:hypothetical protein
MLDALRHYFVNESNAIVHALVGRSPSNADMFGRSARAGRLIHQVTTGYAETTLWATSPFLRLSDRSQRTRDRTISGGFAHNLHASARSAISFPSVKERIVIVLGVDVSKGDLPAVLLADDGRTAKRSFPNREAGFEQLSKWLKNR